MEGVSLSLTRIILCTSNSYAMGMSALPDIYAQARGPHTMGTGVYIQAKHECSWYN